LKLKEILEPYRIISIIGMAKNVGKTTVLNHLIESHGSDRLALTSIGRDGEDVDVVTHKEKPRIFVPAGTIVITAEGLLRLSQVRYKVLRRTGWTSALGEILIIQALSGGRVQIGGPSMTKQLEELMPHLEKFGVDKIYVDGALGRKSLAKPSIAEACVLCTGAALSPDMDEVVRLSRHAVDILTLPEAKEGDDLDIMPMTGAVSDEKLRGLIMSGVNISGKTIVADDPSKFFITAKTYENLKTKGATLAVKKPINLAAVTINPTSPQDYSFDPADFLTKMQASIDLPVFDLVYRS